jgi:hypothetical protein
MKMPCQLRVYALRDFLRLNEVGDMDVERSKAMVRKLAAAQSIHKTDNILVDLRETTVTKYSMNDVLEVASEFIRYQSSFKGKIANIVPVDEDRLNAAGRFKASLVIHGFDYDFFTRFEDAIEWFSITSEAKRC